LDVCVKAADLPVVSKCVFLQVDIFSSFAIICLPDKQQHAMSGLFLLLLLY